MWDGGGRIVVQRCKVIKWYIGNMLDGVFLWDQWCLVVIAGEWKKKDRNGVS